MKKGEKKDPAGIKSCKMDFDPVLLAEDLMQRCWAFRLSQKGEQKAALCVSFAVKYIVNVLKHCHKD